MNKKVIGYVTEEEKCEIQILFERRNGLNELAKILPVENKDLYNRLIKDMGETVTKYQQWWNSMSSKYGWESAVGGSWDIDFDTNEISLITQ